MQDPDPERKRLAVEGLGRISDPSRLPAFKKDYQREKNDEVRLAYSFAITLLGDRAFLDAIVLSLGPSRTPGHAQPQLPARDGDGRCCPTSIPISTTPTPRSAPPLCDVDGPIGDADAIPRADPPPSTTRARRSPTAPTGRSRGSAVPEAEPRPAREPARTSRVGRGGGAADGRGLPPRGDGLGGVRGPARGSEAARRRAALRRGDRAPGLRLGRRDAHPSRPRVDGQSRGGSSSHTRARVGRARRRPLEDRGGTSARVPGAGGRRPLGPRGGSPGPGPSCWGRTRWRSRTGRGRRPRAPPPR